MNYHWNNSELNNFIEYEKLDNEFAICPPEDISEEMRIQYLLLEGKLLMMNKYLVGYVDKALIGIYNFNEALKSEEFYSKKGKIFEYHPVNFEKQDQFVDYFNG